MWWRAGALLLVLGSCGGSNTPAASAPQRCTDACNNVYVTCRSAVNLGKGALDRPSCVIACQNAPQGQAPEWTCLAKVSADDCGALDACLLPLACAGASSLVRTCVGETQGEAVLASCNAAPEAFRPCLSCLDTTACNAMASGCAGACSF